MASAPKTLAKSLFITLLENYPNPFSPTVFFRQAYFEGLIAAIRIYEGTLGAAEMKADSDKLAGTYITK